MSRWRCQEGSSEIACVLLEVGMSNRGLYDVVL